ncbi:MAG: hypothetical protein M0Z52_07490 [Actinomycetota bacterium]|nr:hypothetical protein [Actinomycetota bacterium]
MKKFLLVIFLFLGLAGCASEAGPFVTNISSDGRGGIVVEKCMVDLNRYTQTVDARDCTETNITLYQKK